MTPASPTGARLVLVSLFVLVAACGGGGATPGTPTGTPATRPIGATQAPTAAPPASTGTAVPVETATPGPVTPGPTVPATAEPSAIAATPSLPLATGPTACDHPYWPIRTGAKWTLENGSQEVVLTVLEVRGDATTASALIEALNPGGSKLTNVLQCSAADGIAYGDATHLGKDGKPGMKTLVGREGVELPPLAALTDGATFKNNATADFDFPAYDASGAYTGQVQYQVMLELTCTVKGPEDATLPNQKVVKRFTVGCLGSTTRKSAGEPDRTFPLKYETYWLEGIGHSGALPGTELKRWSIPPLQ